METRALSKTKKPYRNVYWDDAVITPAILEWQAANRAGDRALADRIYTERLHAPFREMATLLQRTQKFIVWGLDTQEMIDDCAAVLYRVLPKFDPTRSSNSYSYFNQVAANEYRQAYNHAKDRRRERVTASEDVARLAERDALALDHDEGASRDELTSSLRKRLDAPHADLTETEALALGYLREMVEEGWAKGSGNPAHYRTELYRRLIARTGCSSRAADSAVLEMLEKLGAASAATTTALSREAQARVLRRRAEVTAIHRARSEELKLERENRRELSELRASHRAERAREAIARAEQLRADREAANQRAQLVAERARAEAIQRRAEREARRAKKRQPSAATERRRALLSDYLASGMSIRDYVASTQCDWHLLYRLITAHERRTGEVVANRTRPPVPPDQKREIARACLASGMAVRDYARMIGRPARSLLIWIRALRASEGISGHSSPAALVPQGQRDE